MISLNCDFSDTGADGHLVLQHHGCLIFSCVQGTETPLGLSAFLDIAEDTAACMASVHEQIIFRGLNPAKLLLNLNGRVRLAGFANAELLSASQSSSASQGNPPASPTAKAPQ